MQVEERGAVALDKSARTSQDELRCQGAVRHTQTSCDNDHGACCCRAINTIYDCIVPCIICCK
jgi:hypothetical protein